MEHIARLLGHSRDIHQRLDQRLLAHHQVDLGDALGVIPDPF
jgi:hypothetical protein